MYAGMMFPGTLPPVLTKEEQRELAVRAKQGDKAARDRLVEHNMLLVAFMVNKYKDMKADPQDMFAAGCFGLVKAVESFDPDKGYELSAYASRCISNEILMMWRSERRRQNTISMDDSITSDDTGNKLRLEEVLSTEPDATTSRQDRAWDEEALMDAMDRLNERERRIVTMLYGLDGGGRRKQSEVARALGLSQCYISRLEQRIIQKLGLILKKAG